jgi:hypothetical protein
MKTFKEFMVIAEGMDMKSLRQIVEISSVEKLLPMPRREVT